jgi:hypothetical protein
MKFGAKYGAESYKMSLSRNENKRNRRRTRSKERRIGKAAAQERNR